MLKRDDVDAVDLIIPIDNMPEFVDLALTAGKHVLSEKPMAPTVELGIAMLKKYHTVHKVNHPGLVWSVAEQFWYEPAWRALMDHREQYWPEKVSGDADRLSVSSPKPSSPTDPASSPFSVLTHVGTPLVATLTRISAMNANNRYYSTKWRFTPNYQGGYLLDGGVHEICKLRMLFGEVEEVTALTHQFRSDLPPADSVSATLRFKSGVLCTYVHTFTASALPVATATVSHDLMISGTHGSINAKNNEVIVNYTDPASNELQRSSIPIENELGQLSIRREIEAFTLAALGKISNEEAYYTPEQALQDVAVIQAILESSNSGKRVQLSSIVPSDTPTQQ